MKNRLPNDTTDDAKTKAMYDKICSVLNPQEYPLFLYAALDRQSIIDGKPKTRCGMLSATPISDEEVERMTGEINEVVDRYLNRQILKAIQEDTNEKKQGLTTSVPNADIVALLVIQQAKAGSLRKDTLLTKAYAFLKELMVESDLPLDSVKEVWRLVQKYAEELTEAFFAKRLERLASRCIVMNRTNPEEPALALAKAGKMTDLERDTLLNKVRELKGK